MTTTKGLRVPKLRKHKPSGRGFVELNGRRIYLGPYPPNAKKAPKATQERYECVLAEWLANGRRLPVDPHTLTIDELFAAYWKHAKAIYARDSSERYTIKKVMRDVRALYRSSRAVDFGPRALKAVRQKWISKKLARTTVNRYVSHVLRAVKWAVSNEMVPVETYQALKAVDGLRKGRSKARETDPVTPVPETQIDAVRPFVARQVYAIIELQLLTAARPGELLTLRPIDFDTTGEVWTVTPHKHKTAYKGRERVLFFGPKAQGILRQFFADRPVDAYLFSPREAEKERYAKAGSHRRANQKPNAKKTDRELGDHYTPASYRRAIERACKENEIPEWTPYRLRHTAATNIRKQFGLEAAQVILGHATAKITEVYAERDNTKARDVIKCVG